MSGIAAALLVERLTGSSRAGFVAGVVYGFYPFHFEHYSHLELQMMQWMPLSLLALHRFLETYRWPWALAAGLCAVAQLYSSMYYAVFFSLYGGVVLAVLVLTRRPSLKRLIIPAVLSAAVAIALVLPLARAVLRGHQDEGRARPRGSAAVQRDSVRLPARALQERDLRVAHAARAGCPNGRCSLASCRSHSLPSASCRRSAPSASPTRPACCSRSMARWDSTA